MIFKFVILFALVATPALCSSIKGYQQQRSEELKGGGRTFLGPIEHQRRLTEQQAAAKGAAAPSIKQEQLKLEQVGVAAPAAEEKIEQLKQEPLKEAQLEQVKEEKIEQIRDEQAKGGAAIRYEARPQISRDELAKGQSQQKAEELSKTRYEQKQQQREEFSKTRFEQKELPQQQQREELSKTSSKGLQQQQQQQQQFTEDLQQENIRTEQQREEAPQQARKTADTRIEQQKEERYEQLQRNTDFDSQIELKEEQRRYDGDSAAFVQPILPLTVVEAESSREQRIEQQQLSSAGQTKGGYVQAAPGAPFGEAEPYAFSYQVDGSSRSESGDTKGVVRGQYTLQGADGSSRIVDYVADHNGFRASVNTNEFGTESKSPAGVALKTSQPNAEDITLKLEGKTKEDLAAPHAPAQASKTSYTKESWAQSAKGGSGAEEQTIAYQRKEELARKSAEKLVAAPAAQALVKSAEHRAFESATAHRAYKAPTPVSAGGQRKQAAAPAVLVRQQQAPVRSFVAGQQPAVSRSYLRAERYPPAAVGLSRAAANYPYAYPPQQPPTQGVSFYSPSQPATGPINFDEELPSFAESAELN